MREPLVAQEFLTALRSRGIEEAETNSVAIFQEYKNHGLCGLLVPPELGGHGWSARQIVEFLLEVGAMAPSVALGAVMHNFSVAGLAASWRYGGEELAPVLQSVAGHQQLVSSGFAELGLSSSLTKPAMSGRRSQKGWVLNGVKRPCSLSKSMDLLTASVWLEDDGGDVGYAVALIDARSPGIRVEKLWQNHVLQGAQSDAVVLENVEVGDDQVLRPDQDMAAETAVLQVVGMNWFLVMVLAAYVGMAGRLVEELMAEADATSGRGVGAQRLGSAVRGCEVMVRALSDDIDREEADPHSMQRRLLDGRTMIECALKVVTAEAPDVMRGSQFISNGIVSVLRESLTGLVFHPPMREERYRASEVQG